MKKIIFIIIMLTFKAIAFPGELIIDSSLKKALITQKIDYCKDPGGLLTIDDIIKGGMSWSSTEKNDFNFGFSPDAYWFRFTAVNPEKKAVQWLFELNYPMIDSIRLYVPNEKKGFSVKETGDHLPYDSRDIKDRNFVFSLETMPGECTYYMRISTTSSINFTVFAWSIKAYFDNVFYELPLLWIYYGLMGIMVLYNLFLFFSIRDSSYIYYVGFIAFWILFQLTLNGLAFQYLWSTQIWWANNCLPFFMALVAFFGGLFSRGYMKTAVRYKRFDKIIIGCVLVPSFLLAIFSLSGNYRMSIKLTSINSAVFSFLLIPLSAILSFRGSRSARFYLLGFGGLLSGISIYVFKTFGLISANIFTNWSVQAGSSLMVVLLSLGLADMINNMKKDLEALNSDVTKNERKAKERAAYLEGIVRTVRNISNDLVRISGELARMGTFFSTLSSEQASTSEQMSATFGHLVQTNNGIYLGMVNQSGEGKRTKELSQSTQETQIQIAKDSFSVVENIQVISESTNATEAAMRVLFDKMNVVHAGGKTIDKFVVMIDDISDRINLLSLNAAIEAARAGEHGRGFAVVADEIGKLAGATADNSKEISTQIRKIIKDIDEGMGMFENTKKSIETTFQMVQSINSRIEHVRDLMTGQAESILEVVRQAKLMDALSDEVTTAAKDQNTAMEETLKTIARLSEIASEIARSDATINEITASINDKVSELNGLVENIE